MHDAQTVVVPANVHSLPIHITIMDDLCREPGSSEDFYVHVGIPGGPNILSHYYRARVRIDDNDADFPTC